MNPTQIPVLTTSNALIITGPAGSGKEHLAEYVLSNSSFELLVKENPKVPQNDLENYRSNLILEIRNHFVKNNKFIVLLESVEIYPELLHVIHDLKDYEYGHLKTTDLHSQVFNKYSSSEETVQS